MTDRFDVTLEGQPSCTVELEELDDGRTRIRIEAREMLVDARRLDSGAWSLLHRPDGDAPPAPVSTARLLYVDGPLDKLAIEISHPDGEPRTVTAAVAAFRRAASAGEAARHADATSPITLRAPIPGKIVKLTVKPGDQVTAGQSLLVLEAMKMENEIRAPRAGEVKSIHTAEGESVDSGQELVSLI